MSGWWIDPPLILGSGNPTIEQLRDLYAQGFRSIISLLDETEQSPRYDRQVVAAIGFHRYSLPLRDFTAPTTEQIQTFLQTLQVALPAGGVVVHCQGGSGRTGTMAAAYWIDQGLSAAQAIAKVRAANAHAVETGEQEDSLYAFAVHAASRLAETPPLNKADLLARIDRAYTVLIETIGRLTPAQIVTRPTEDAWSVKDIVAHIATWEQALVRYCLQRQPFEAAVEIAGAQPGTAGEDELNAQFFRRFQHWTWDNVWSFLQASHQQTLAALTALPETEWLKPVSATVSTATEPLLNHVIWNTYDHYIHHLETIRGLVFKPFDVADAAHGKQSVC